MLKCKGKIAKYQIKYHIIANYLGSYITKNNNITLAFIFLKFDKLNLRFILIYERLLLGSGEKEKTNSFCS